MNYDPVKEADHWANKHGETGVSRQNYRRIFLAAYDSYFRWCHNPNRKIPYDYPDFWNDVYNDLKTITLKPGPKLTSILITSADGVQESFPTGDFPRPELAQLVIRSTLAVIGQDKVPWSCDGTKEEWASLYDKLYGPLMDSPEVILAVDLE